MKTPEEPSAEPTTDRSNPAPDAGAPRLLVATRFGIGIKDPAWFEHRLAVMSAITAPSLLAQGDRGFEWGIFVDPDLPESARRGLDDIVDRFDGSAFVDSDGHTPGNLLRLAVERGLQHRSGHVLTGRIDDDDAWSTSTVGRVRAFTADWLNRRPSAPGFGLTFANGLVWVMYEMLDIDRLQSFGDSAKRGASIRSYTCPWISISEFVCSPLSIGMTPIRGSHAKVPEELAEEGFEVHVLDNEEPMWLYCRHKQTDSGIERATPEDELRLSIEDLGTAFGIDGARTGAYIRRSAEYGYLTRKRIFDRRGDLHGEFTGAEGSATGRASHDIELASLAQKASRRRQEWARLGQDLIAPPERDVGAVAYCHVIQTPFSARAPWGAEELLDDELDRRLQLLDSYCLPSLAAQSCADFTLHLYCDEDTDPSILEALQERAGQVPRMRIAITGPNGRTPAQHVLDDTALEDTVVLTTRVDSDAAIADDCVEAIQGHVDEFGRSGEGSLLLNLPRGYKPNAMNGFQTLFERLSADPTTLLGLTAAELQPRG